ncbi:NADH dehydrogenase FAD-containing subunit, partial [Bacillus anthracis]
YIGCLWLIEGLKKLLGESTWESMWKADSIGDFFKNITIGADSWTKSGNIKMPFEWLQQATSGASASTETAAEFATPILKEVPGWYAAIMQVMMPNPEVAVWFQRIVVLMEIGMGLCLIAGLFTFIFSAVSAGMVVNFVLCAMAGWDILWFFFGSIALMSGAGRTFGLDYYIMPWITRLADNFWHGKKQPMYKNV